MFISTFRTLLLLFALALTTLAPSLFEPDASGVWKIELRNEAAAETITVTLQQEDSLLSGHYLGQFGPSLLQGTMEHDAIAFSYAIDGMRVIHLGTIVGNTISGFYHAGDIDQGAFKGRKIR
jgi:hypothetical protein